MSNSFPPPPSNNPYHSPVPSASPFKPPLGNPAVLMWYRVYCVIMGGLYLLLLGLGLFFVFAASNADMMRAMDFDSPAEPMILGFIYAVMGGLMAALFFAGAIFCRGTFGWVFGIILIAIGLTSCCTWPATIPLLIQWIKAENKAMIVGR